MQLKQVNILIIALAVLITLATNFGSNFSYLTYFLFLETQPSLDSFFSLSLEHTYLVMNQWWRLITPIFLHFSVTHLIFNCLWIYVLGSRVEALDGKVIFFLVLCTSGIMGNLSQYLWSSSYLFGGLSGAVYGLLGYCFIIELDNKKAKYGLPEALYLFMFIWLLIGFTGILKFFGFGNVANLAHLVGMITGFIAGTVAKSFPNFN